MGRRNNRAGTRTEYVCMAGKNFPETDIENTTLVDYDKDKLQTQIDALDCMDADNQTAPENASVSSYDKTEGFTVVGCVMGTTIDAEKMYQAVQEAVEGLKENLSLEKPAFMKIRRF